MAALLAILACVFASVAAQRPCCAPRQWEGFVATRFSPNNTLREAFSRLSFDFINQVTSSNETLIGQRETIRQHVLVNGTSRTMYIVDHHSRECRIIALDRGFEPPCVPGNFRGEGIFGLGAGSDSLAISTFRGNVADVDVQITTTSATCVPISQLVANQHFHELRSFVNITAGIRDRSVFNVPPECRRAGLPIVRRTLKELRTLFPLLKNVFLGYFSHY